MTAGTKSDFEARASAFLEAAEAKCLKWNGSTWLRTRYLFGTLCVEARRQWFASDLLRIMGYTLGPPIRIHYYKNLGKDFASGELRIWGFCVFVTDDGHKKSAKNLGRGKIPVSQECIPKRESSATGTGTVTKSKNHVFTSCEMADMRRK